MAGVFTFDEAAHEYRLDGKRLPSVTQILRPLAPDFSAIPPAILERKRALGTAVHLACELDDLGELDESSLDEEVAGYLAGWRKFKADQCVTVLLNEKRLYHPRLGYAGTLDRFLRTDRDPWLIDLKTAIDPAPVYGPQLAAYQELLTANADDLEHPVLCRGPMRRASLHLDGEGRYRLHEFRNPNDWPAFMACLTLSQWKETNQ